jgi:hypothetical protein
MIHLYSIAFIVGVRCCDMIGYVAITYSGCKEVDVPQEWLADALKAEKFCVCVSLEGGGAVTFVPATSHTCGANGASAPAPRGPWPSCCCHPNSNTSGIQRQVTTLPSPFSTASYPLFVPHPTSSIYSTRFNPYLLPHVVRLFPPRTSRIG